MRIRQRMAELRQEVPEVTPGEACELQRRGAVLIDVREPDERTADHVEGTLFRPLSRLHEWEHEFDGQSVVFQCRSGNRSQQVALYLGDRVRGANLEGGILAYRAEGLP